MGQIVRINGRHLRLDTEFASSMRRESPGPLADPLGRGLRLSGSSTALIPLSRRCTHPGTVLTIAPGGRRLSRTSSTPSPPNSFPRKREELQGDVPRRSEEYLGISKIDDRPFSSEEFTLAFKPGPDELGNLLEPLDSTLSPSLLRVRSSTMTRSAPLTVSPPYLRRELLFPRTFQRLSLDGHRRHGERRNLATLTDVEYQNSPRRSGGRRRGQPDRVSRPGHDHVSTSTPLALRTIGRSVRGPGPPGRSRSHGRWSSSGHQFDSARGYAALYYPWIKVAPLGAGEPGSSHLPGTFAASSRERMT